MCCGHAGLPSVMHTIGLSRKDQLVISSTMQLATSISILIKQKAEYRSVKNLDRKSVLQHSGVICSASHDELQIMFNPIVRCFCSSAHSWKHVSTFMSCYRPSHVPPSLLAHAWPIIIDTRIFHNSYFQSELHS